MLLKRFFLRDGRENLSNDNDDGNDCLHLIIIGNYDEFESLR